MQIIGIVDDDRSVRDALARLLVSCGYTVVRFASAEDFLATASEVDCLVLDVQLPGLSGLDLAHRLRVLDRTIPVVFITGQTDPRVHDAVRATAVPWLQKPFDEHGLLAAIHRAMVTTVIAPDAGPTHLDQIR
jgi:FixJ family two-component response regulator